MTYTSLSSASLLHHRAGWQQITHMVHGLMVFTLRYEIVTVVSAMLTGRRGRTPAGGRTLSTCAQIHVAVEKISMRINYCLAKHPLLPHRREIRRKLGPRFGTTLPLEHFVEQWEE